MSGADSIYTHIQDHLSERGLEVAGLQLPGQSSAAGWAPGTEEHLRRVHVGPRDVSVAVEAMRTTVRAMLAGLLPDPVTAMRASFAEHGSLEAADGLGVAVSELGDDGDWVGLYTVLRAVAETATEPGAVKMAISLLGRFRNVRDRDLFFTLAHHPEFSLYSAVALASLDVERPQDALLELLPRTQGWAQADVIEMLTRFTESAEVREALLRIGTRIGGGLASYMALPLAQGLPLGDVLSDPTLEPEDLDGAARVLSRLARDAMGSGPAGNLSHLPAPLQVIGAFLARIREALPTVDTVEALAAIRVFLDGPALEEEASGERVTLRSVVAEELESGDNAGALRAALTEHPGTAVAAQAAKLAGELELAELLPEVLNHLDALPADAGAIRTAWALDAEAAADTLLELWGRVSDEGTDDSPRDKRTLGPGLARTMARAAIVGGAGTVARTRALRVIHLAQRDPEPDVRSAAVVSCLDLSPNMLDELARENLIALLGDPAPVVAAAAAGACGPLRITAAHERLASLAAAHPEEMVRQAAKRSLDLLDAAEDDADDDAAEAADDAGDDAE